ncbi:MAG: hypothetical protein HYU64_04020 [Armatimonadetes bacterium]|nr:hypothetical protein [Armatimonadota bacterium]
MLSRNLQFLSTDLCRSLVMGSVETARPSSSVGEGTDFTSILAETEAKTEKKKKRPSPEAFSLKETPTWVQSQSFQFQKGVNVLQLVQKLPSEISDDRLDMTAF